MDEPQQSLIDRAVQRLSQPAVAHEAPPPGTDWRFAVALAALIALAPLATIVGARLLERRERAAAEGLLVQTAPQRNAVAAERDSRRRFNRAVRGATVAVWLDRLAASLPADTRLSRMTRLEDGRIEVDILAPDPDTLRGALRRSATLSFLREAGQRRSEAMTLVTLRGRP